MTSPPAAPVVDCSPSDVFAVWMTISAQHRLLLHRALARAEIHPGQAMMLRVLAHHGECGQSELADALAVSRPNVTRILQRLERAGLVARRTDEEDQRHSRVVLTDAGRAVVTRLEEALEQHITSTVARLSVPDRCALAQGLRAWTTILEEAMQ